MLLWTIQKVEALQALESKGRIRGDWRRVLDAHRPAYRWMGAQLFRRGIAPRPCCPVWAWHSWDGQRRRRPDLRSAGHLHPGTRGVRIELDVTPTKVLSSCFDMWHAALNGWYLSLSADEEEKIVRDMEAGRISVDNMRRSWERMFDLECGDPEWRGKPGGRSIQAATYEFRLDEAREVTHFVAR